MAKANILVSAAGWLLGFTEKLIRELKKRGVTDEAIYSFVTEKGDAAVEKIADELAKLMKVNIPFKYDKTQDGWKLLEDVPFSGAFTPDIKEFLKSGESYVNGEVMKQRAKELNAHLGQHHAEYLLEHQGLIPKEWRNKYLVFPGTVWLDCRGDRDVPYLHWDGDEWYLCFSWLERGWGGSYRLVGSRE